MSAGNGIIRIGRKGRKKFAIGEEGEPFEIDIVVAFQEWVSIDNSFRENSEDRTIPVADMAAYHQAAVDFVTRLSNGTATEISTTEALDFVARLREQYDEVSAFFQPKSRVEPESLDSSGAELRFSAEAS